MSPRLALGDTLAVLNKCGNMDGKHPEMMMLPRLRGRTKPSILDNWTDLSWCHHLPTDHNITASQAQPDLSLSSGPWPAQAPERPGCLLGVPRHLGMGR